MCCLRKSEHGRCWSRAPPTSVRQTHSTSNALAPRRKLAIQARVPPACIDAVISFPVFAHVLQDNYTYRVTKPGLLPLRR